MLGQEEQWTMLDAQSRPVAVLLASRGATADYMAALSAQLTCGDDCRVIGPAGYGLNSLLCWAALERSLVCSGLARPMGRVR